MSTWQKFLDKVLPAPEVEKPKTSAPGPDFSEVKGQRLVKRAMEVAVAGGHNIVMVGPPGCGKSMIASRVPGIMPPMTERERQETAMIYQMSGWPFDGKRPFQEPHHSASYASIVGGGSSRPHAGMISLAHNGVLFMDELPEFSRNTLESLRQPLESDKITVSRTGGIHTYPARFMLIAAMNPCPCGKYGETDQDGKSLCTCKPDAVRKYRAKISGPLMDRIDIHIRAEQVTWQTLELPPGELSANIRVRVKRARDFQLTRQGGLNARLAPGQAEALSNLDSDARKMLRSGLDQMALSARAYERVLRIARTIADIELAERVLDRHIGEALGYRMLDQ